MTLARGAIVRGALVTCVLAGCLDAVAPEVGPISMATTCNDDSDPDRAVSFSTDVSPIFRRSCDQCHTPGGDGETESGLDLSTYTSLLAGGSRSINTIVVAGQPCESVLYQKISPAPPFGARMPRGRTPLPASELALIHDWIAEGALEN